MQKKMEALQEELDQKEIEVSGGGGAVKVTISLTQEVRKIDLDPELLKEEKSMIEEALVEAIKEANARAKQLNEEAMNELSAGLQLPGMPGLF